MVLEVLPCGGYTALSRVERASDYMLADDLTREHFVPATWLDPAAARARSAPFADALEPLTDVERLGAQRRGLGYLDHSG